MKKKKIILMLVVCVLVMVGSFFGLKKIQFQSILKNNDQVVTASIQELGKESKQETASNEQQSVVSNQEAGSNEQQAVTSNQKPVTVEKESAAVVEQKTETKNTDAGKIVQNLVAWGFQKSAERKIDTIILHSSYDALGNDPFSVSGVIAEYKKAQVSPHYLIARDGTIYQLVSDQNIAWHAGVAKMPDGRTDVNSFSIGVEIINTQTGKFTDQQYSAVNSLIATLKKKYPIKNILGHSDIAPGRKTDPWGIEWKKVDR